MKKGFRRGMGWLIALVLILGMACAWAEEEENEIVPVLELPEAKNGKMAELTVEEDPMIGPHSNYKYANGGKNPTGYADPSITVNIGKGRIYKTNYVYARVKIANPLQIRTASAEESLASVKTVLGSKLASRVKAVVAVNGVLEADKSSGSNVAFVHAPIKRQGVWMRPAENTTEDKLASWRDNDVLDTLVIDSQGDMKILSADTWGDMYDQIVAMGDDAVNVITFGPALVVDGEPQYGERRMNISANKVAQRMAICQTGPLEYLLITSEGPDDPDSEGLKLDQFVELIASFPGVQTAYNLDGGSSSTLIFRKGDTNWAKINAPKNPKKRPLRDIIYFADAWIPKKKK